jgi:hypothetical protein
MKNADLNHLVHALNCSASMVPIAHLADLETSIQSLYTNLLLAEENNLEGFANFNFRSAR